MGIGSGIIDVLADLRLAGQLRRKAAVMEIGAQQLASSFLLATDRVDRLGYLFGITRPLHLPSPVQTHLVHGRLEHLDPNAPTAQDFWRWLGFTYASIDIDGSPGSIPLDLNTDDVPPEAVGKYDLVTNFGTTEHVANQLNAFKIIHELTAVGGLMMHELPAQGMFNHGLLNYNFKFFWMLGRSNGYHIVRADYNSSSQAYGFPTNIADFVAMYNPQPHPGMLQTQAADSAIQIIMQKQYDIPYVPALDVPTGTKTDFEPLKKRYWTVFDPDAFTRIDAARLQRKQEKELARLRLRERGRRVRPRIG